MEVKKHPGRICMAVMSGDQSAEDRWCLRDGWKPNINVHNVSDSISRMLKPNEGNSSDLLEPHIPQRFTLNSLHLPTHTATWSNLPISPPSGSSLHRRKDSIWIQFIQAASSQTKDRLLRNTAVYRAFCTNITQFVPELPSSYGTSFWFGFFCCCFF